MKYPPSKLVIHFGATVEKPRVFFSQLPLTAVSTPRIPGRVHIFSSVDHLRKFSSTSTQRCRPVSMGWDKFRQEGSDWWPSLVLFDVFLTKSHWRNSSPQNLKTQEMQIYFREDLLNLSVSFSKKNLRLQHGYLPKVRGGLLLPKLRCKAWDVDRWFEGISSAKDSGSPSFENIMGQGMYTRAKTNMETNKFRIWRWVSFTLVEFENCLFRLRLEQDTIEG